MRVPTVDQTNLRRRAAQFGWLTTGLVLLSLGFLFVLAVVLTVNGAMGTAAGSPGGCSCRSTSSSPTPVPRRWRPPP